jgi:hypothetical protein
MIDRYTKTVLTVIAAALVAFVIQEVAPKVIAWYSNRSANAGWFSPSNYSECMLDKMKGLPWNMEEIVAKACILQFACNDIFKADFLKCLQDGTKPIFCAIRAEALPSGAL